MMLSSMHRGLPRTSHGRGAAARTRRGVASVLSMMFLVMFGSLAAAMAVVAQGNMRTADSALKLSRAMSAAETGLVFAQRRLEVEGARFVIEKGVVNSAFAEDLWLGTYDEGADGSVDVLSPTGYTTTTPPSSLAEAVRDAHLADTHAIVAETGDSSLPAIDETYGTLRVKPIALSDDGANGPYFRLRYELVSGEPAIRVTSIGVDSDITRTLQMDFEITKKIEYAILSHGLETAVRLRREWVVRVAEGAAEPPPAAQRHAHLPLARLTRAAGGAAIGADAIEDLRRTGLKLIPRQAIEQITADAFGPAYDLERDGQPRLKVSLRSAINALLAGTLPSTPIAILPSESRIALSTSAVTTTRGEIFVACIEFDADANESTFCVHRYPVASPSWSREVIARRIDSTGDGFPILKQDTLGGVWAVWCSDEGELFYRRFFDGRWLAEVQLTSGTVRNQEPALLAHSNGDVWIFWSRRTSGSNHDILAVRVRSSTGLGPDSEEELASSSGRNERPDAVEIENGDILLVFHSERDGNVDIFTRRFDLAADRWETTDTRITRDAGADMRPRAIVDGDGNRWVFWASDRLETGEIFHRFQRAGSTGWAEDVQLTERANLNIYSQPSFFVVADRAGGLMAGWAQISNAGDRMEVVIKRYHAERGWGVEETVARADPGMVLLLPPVACLDLVGDIWVFWAEGPWSPGGFNRMQVKYKRLIPQI
jgi:hypothetical protein